MEKMQQMRKADEDRIHESGTHTDTKEDDRKMRKCYKCGKPATGMFGQLCDECFYMELET